jgi:hypothetical protein
MAILSDFLPFVKDQAAYHDRQAIRYRSDPKKLRKHTDIAATFRKILAAIEKEAYQPTGVNTTASLPLPAIDDTIPERSATSSAPLTPAEVADLPPDLLAQLGISASEGQDMTIMKIINDAGGVLSLDRLLIALYHKTGEVHQRQKLTARLYRMIQKDLLYSVPRKKGLYSIKPLTETKS